MSSKRGRPEDDQGEMAAPPTQKARPPPPTLFFGRTPIPAILRRATPTPPLQSAWAQPMGWLPPEVRWDAQPPPPRAFPSSSSSLLGKGAYGCVFRPALPCAEGILHLTPGTVGKVFNRGDDRAANIAEVEHEKTAYQRLDAMDDQFQFHVRSYGSCLLAADRRHHGDPVCNTLRGMPQLIMEDGGQTVRQWCDAHLGAVSMAMLLEACRPLFEGVGKLSGADLFNPDIKDDNLMVGPTSPAKFKYIDLGLLLSWDKVLEQRALGPRASPYAKPYGLYPAEWDYVAQAGRSLPSRRTFGNMAALLNLASRLPETYITVLKARLTHAANSNSLMELAGHSDCWRANQYCLGAGLLVIISAHALPVPVDSRLGRALLRMTSWDPRARFRTHHDLLSALYDDDGAAAAGPPTEAPLVTIARPP